MAPFLQPQAPAALRAALVAHCARKFGLAVDAVEGFVAPLTIGDIAASLRLGVEDCLLALATRRHDRLSASLEIAA